MANEELEAEIGRLAAEAAERWQVDYDARQRPRMPTPEEEIAERLTQARFRERFGEIALKCGVRGKAIKFIMRDAVEVFRLTDDGEFAPIHGDVDPADPLSPLSPERWLERLRVAEPFMFA